MNTPNTTISRFDGTTRIVFRGEIDLANAYLLREAVDEALTGDKPSRIVVDLGRVTMIDSVGIGVLVACFYAAAASDIPLTVARPSTLVYRQLWVSGLVGLFGLPTPPIDRRQALPGTAD